MSNISPVNQNEQWILLVYLLDDIRRQKKITHDEIAEKTGYHRSNVTRFFSAKYKPGLDVFLEIAKAIKVNFFFEDQEDTSDLNLAFENSMEKLGRRPDKLPKN
jgi:transcriptional regulator with XRE-family HTH domain